MVRHEAGEALGAIGDPSCIDILSEYAEDSVAEVAETCQIALHRLKWLQNSSGDVPSSAYDSVGRYREFLLGLLIKIFILVQDIF